MAKPWLSVIIPSHNGEQWLSTALQSLVDQKDDEIEVILIDTSRTDEALHIAADFSNKLDIRVQRRPDLLAWTAKTNFGVQQASGERISMLHQDDLWLPGRCVKLRRWLSAQPDSVMLLHPCYIIDTAGRRLGLWRCPLPNCGVPVPTSTLVERLLIQNFIAIPAPTIRRDAYLAVGGLDTRLWYTADWDLYLKIAAVGPVHYHSDPMACFRIHKSSQTVIGGRDSSEFRNQQETVVERHIGQLSPKTRLGTLRLARASIDVNTALAALITRDFAQLIKALRSVLSLGPRQMRRYFYCSRILDRALPRLRALASGRF